MNQANLTWLQITRRINGETVTGYDQLSHWQNNMMVWLVPTSPTTIIYIYSWKFPTKLSNIYNQI